MSFLNARTLFALNASLGGVLVFSWLALLPGRIEPSIKQSRELTTLEDSVALHQAGPTEVLRLAQAYLALGRPGQAHAILSRSAFLQNDERLLDALSRSYEAKGELSEAFAMSELAARRCELTDRASQAAPGFERTCGMGRQLALESHADALALMLRWGVVDPVHDQRAKLAYSAALRRARVASVLAAEE